MASACASSRRGYLADARAPRVALLAACLAACAPPATQEARAPGAPEAPVPPREDAPPGVVAATSEAPEPAGPCEGATVDLLSAIAEPACRISEAEADRLREVLEDPVATPLRVDAVVSDGVLRGMVILNTGSAPAVLPLLVHTHLDAFPAKAGPHVLEPPVPAWPEGFRFEPGRMLTKIVLPPGGRAVARVRLDFEKLTVLRSEVAGCPPEAKCAPTVVRRDPLRAALPLRFRTPLYAAREDLEATVRWAPKPVCSQPAPCGPGLQRVPGCPGGVRPRPDDCPLPGRCVPVGAPVERCLPRP